MTQDNAEYLEELAATLASHGSNLAALRMAELEQKVSPYLAAPGAPSRQVGSDVVANTLGNVQPVVGRTNLLPDPCFDGLRPANLTLTTSAQTVAHDPSVVDAWAAWKDNTSATCIYAPDASRLSVVDHFFNSGVVGLRVQATGAGTHLAYLRSAPVNLAYSPQSMMPYLVGAVGFYTSYTQTLTNVTSVTLRLQLFNEATGLVNAEETADFRDPPLNLPRRISTALLAATYFPAGSTFRLRAVLEVVTTGAGADVRVSLGEAAMHFAHSPDAMPFMPALGLWAPGYLSLSSAGSTANQLVSGCLFDDTADRYQVYVDGVTRWGGGSAAADVRLSRSGTKTLTIDDTAAGAATLNVVGAIQNGGTQVVGARQTGWGAPTGTATRTTFATDTVTLIELARRLKALIDDLTTHGLVGP